MHLGFSLTPDLVRAIQYAQAVSGANDNTLTGPRAAANESWYILNASIDRSVAIAAPGMWSWGLLTPAASAGPGVKLTADGGSVQAILADVPFSTVEGIWLPPLWYLRIFTNAAFADAGILTMRYWYIPFGLQSTGLSPGAPSLQLHGFGRAAAGAQF